MDVDSIRVASNSGQVAYELTAVRRDSDCEGCF